MKHRKIAPPLAAGALTTIACWLLAAFYTVTVPAEVAASIVTALTILISVLTPDHMEAA